MPDDSTPSTVSAEPAGFDASPRPGLPGQIWLPLLSAALVVLLLAVG